MAWKAAVSHQCDDSDEAAAAAAAAGRKPSSTAKLKGGRPISRLNTSTFKRFLSDLAAVRRITEQFPGQIVS